MDQTAAVAGASAPVEFMGLTLAPITGRGWGRITQWVKDQVFALAVTQLENVNSDRDKRLIMDRAFAFAGRLTLFLVETDDPEAYAAFHRTLTTMGGVTAVVRESMLAAQRKANAYPGKTITDDWVDSILENCENPVQLFEQVMAISNQSLQRWGANTGQEAPSGRAAKNEGPASLWTT
jgi:hypothetical protein